MKVFMRADEVAAILRVRKKTFQNCVSKHKLYKPGHPGVWHVEHVEIIKRVWSGALSEDEGFAFWVLAKDKMRRDLERALNVTSYSKCKRRARSTKAG